MTAFDLAEPGRLGYSARTFSARGPFGPWPIVKVTAWPGDRSSNRVPLHAEWWKKYSVPSGVEMNPYPLSVVRLTVPRLFVMSGPLIKCRAHFSTLSFDEG